MRFQFGPCHVSGLYGNVGDNNLFSPMVRCLGRMGKVGQDGVGGEGRGEKGVGGLEGGGPGAYFCVME